MRAHAFCHEWARPYGMKEERFDCAAFYIAVSAIALSCTKKSAVWGGLRLLSRYRGDSQASGLLSCQSPLPYEGTSMEVVIRGAYSSGVACLAVVVWSGNH